MFILSRGRATALLAWVVLVAASCKDGSGAPGTESAAATVADDTTSAVAPRGKYRSAAEKVVTQIADVKEGDILFAFGTADDLPFLEDIAVEARKRGADPLVSVGTERLARRMYDEVPAKYDSQPPEMMLKIAGMADVFVYTEAGEGRTLSGVAPERIAARGKAFNPVVQLMQKRGVRAVALGNGLYPNAERAEQFGLSRDQLADMMYGGVDTDYPALQAAGQQVRNVLAAGKQLHITNPNGTDLKVGISGRPITVNDGIISAEDRKKGGAATSVYLPAGEVYFIPVLGTAEGTVVADQYFFQGKPIKALRLEFKAGKLTSMTAKEGLEPLKAAYDAGGAGRDLLSLIDLGINPGIKSPERSSLHVWSKAGTVTIGMGNNLWAGGDNQTPFGIAAYSPGSTVTVDGKPLVQDGKLVALENVANR
jgi:leucyl aminopeptidase (aminopeptidase T)